MCLVMWLVQFHDSWKTLCDWLDVHDRKLRQSSTNMAKMKQDLEELQVSVEKHRTLDLQLSVKSTLLVPSFHNLSVTFV